MVFVFKNESLKKYKYYLTQYIELTQDIFNTHILALSQRTLAQNVVFVNNIKGSFIGAERVILAFQI